MREIKFRAWNKYKNEMNRRVAVSGKNVIAIWADDYGQICSRFIDDQNDARYDYIPMQYTGLKDKNEVEIYEGDICRCWGGSEFNGYYEYNKIYEVKWQGSGFEMMIDDCGYGWNYSSGFEYIEIIGNIYENKELLN